MEEYERVKRLISNLEELYAQGKIKEEIYRRLLREYGEKLSIMEKNLSENSSKVKKSEISREEFDNLISHVDQRIRYITQYIDRRITNTETLIVTFNILLSLILLMLLVIFR